MSFKRIYVIFILITLILGFSFAQESDDDKYTTRNVQLKTVYTCSKGLIVEYYAEGKDRLTYLPNKFFEQGKALRIMEGDPKITPQMNIIYKNLEPMKVKIYTPRIYAGTSYQVIGFLSKEQKEAFNTDELKFDFGDEEEEKKKGR